MSDRLIPEDFDASFVPDHTADLGRWLRINGIQEDVVEIICVNNITGSDFKSLTDRDLKDLIPQFLQRKHLRDWLIGVVSGATSVVEDVSEGGDTVDNGDSRSEMLGSTGPSHISEAAEAEADRSKDSPEARTSGKRSSSTSPLPSQLCSQCPFFWRVHEYSNLRSQEKSRQAVPSLGASSVSVTDQPHLEGVVSMAQHLNLVVPASVRECRRNMVMLTSRARNETISSSLIILQATIGRDKPTQSEFEVCAQKILALVPELKDPLPPIRQDAFKEWNTACMLLKKAYYNRKPVEKPHKKRSGEFEDGETASTQEGHDRELVREMKKSKPDIRKIHGLMTASFSHRRKWIVKQQGKGTVKKILEEYPGFRTFPQIMIETYLITKSYQYKEAWNKLLPSLWDFVKEECSDLFSEHEDDEIDPIDADGRTSIVMKSLPRAWGIQEPFIHFLDDTVNFETFIKKDLNADCHLVATDKDDQEQLFVIIDNEVLLETDSYMQGLFTFFEVHHVFNLEFPQKLKLCFKFLEEYVFSMPQKK